MIKFKAITVEALCTKYSEDCAVFQIFFEEGNPENGAQSWNFQRALGSDGTIESFGEDDEGVCTVKEIQQLTFYEGISEFKIYKNHLYCIFDENAKQIVGADKIEIIYDLSEEEWIKLSNMAQIVFTNCNFFKNCEL